MKSTYKIFIKCFSQWILNVIILITFLNVLIRSFFNSRFGIADYFIITNFLILIYYLSFAGDRRQYSLNLCRQRARACLKNHFRNLHAPLCGRFHPNSVAVAHYAPSSGRNLPQNCDAHLAESLFQTRSKACACVRP